LFKNFSTDLSQTMSFSMDASESIETVKEDHAFCHPPPPSLRLQEKNSCSVKVTNIE
jgi:hypothetical protein